MEALVEVDSVESFMIDSLLQSVKMIEGISSRTPADITGLADVLGKNPEFVKLTKLLFIKYGVFSRVPTEYQLIFIVATSTYLVMHQNKAKKNLERYLNGSPNSLPDKAVTTS
jgi:hypothetical protein